MLSKFFRYAFARSGDKTAVPDPVVGGGDVSYDQGYGPDYELPKTNPNAKDIERRKMNQVLNDITLAISVLQGGTIAEWIPNADNGGVAYSYSLGALVRYTDGYVYISRKNSNTSLPTVRPDWEKMGDAGFAHIAVYRRVGGVQQVSIDGAAFTATGSGSFIVPPSGSYRAKAWGGGGGSGGTFGANSGSQGGGGGGYAELTLFGQTPGASLAVTVGAGGVGGVSGGGSPTAGTAGGTSSVGTVVSATGGGGGTAASGGVASGTATAGVGTTGTGGGIGAGGGSPNTPFIIAAGVVQSMGGGAAYGGAPPRHAGAQSVSAAGGTGIFPGGGASGSLNQANGGDGADGLVTIEY